MKRILFFIFLSLLAAPVYGDEETSVGGHSDLYVGRESVYFSEKASDPSSPSANNLKLYAKDKAGTTTLYTKDSAGTVTEVGAGGGAMVYPGAGIALSTGAAWDTSIANNSSNWNTAYGWGNHASAGYLTAEVDGSITNELPIAGTAIDISGSPASTVDWDSTEVEATTWGAGGNASNAWTFNVSGTDHTMTAGSARMTFSNDVTVSGDLTITGDDLFMNTNTSGAVLVADGTNFNPVVLNGDASISTAGVLGVNKTRLNVRNETGVQIASTKAVYVSGFNNFPLIALADNTDETKHGVIGVTVAPINHEANGFIATNGQCDAETNAWTVGDKLYLSTSGSLTNVLPTSGAVKIIGVVTVQQNYPDGKILIEQRQEEHTLAGGSATDLILRTGDSSGVNKISFRDYSNAEVAFISSDGIIGDTTNRLPKLWATDITVTNAIDGSVTGNSGTATALAANGSNCDAGNYPLGVDPSGAVESCTAAPTQASLSVDDLITLSGVAEGSTHLGTFTGTTIADNQTIKAGLQALETSVETKLPLSGGTMSGDITLGENTAVALDPAGSADEKWSGITTTGTAGATLAVGDLIYLDVTATEWLLADADAASTSGDVPLGICILAANDGQATNILLVGTIRSAAFPASIALGAPVYVDVTAGDITATAPTGTDDVMRRVGWAMTAEPNTIYFNPSNDYVTHT